MLGLRLFYSRRLSYTFYNKMCYLITFLILFLSIVIAPAQNKINGKIAKQSWGVTEKKPVKLQYIFDGENLTLTHVGGIVNAGAKSTVAEYSEKNGVISLKIREHYGDFGPADSLMSVDVSYKLIGKFGESIKITIDDSNTEGGGASYAFSFKLKKTKEAITIMPVKKL